MLPLLLLFADRWRMVMIAPTTMGMMGMRIAMMRKAEPESSSPLPPLESDAAPRSSPSSTASSPSGPTAGGTVGAVAGLAAGSNGALAANVLPCHPATGQPLNAARDSMLLGSMTMLTGAVVPAVLGHAFVLFDSKVAAYRSFFLAAAAIHFFSVCLLFKVDPAGEKRRAVADEAERWLNKPVISINVVTYWHGLRALGINDQFRGFTQLFSRF